MSRWAHMFLMHVLSLIPKEMLGEFWNLTQLWLKKFVALKSIFYRIATEDSYQKYKKILLFDTRSLSFLKKTFFRKWSTRTWRLKIISNKPNRCSCQFSSLEISNQSVSNQSVSPIVSANHGFRKLYNTSYREEYRERLAKRNTTLSPKLLFL